MMVKQFRDFPPKVDIGPEPFDYTLHKQGSISALRAYAVGLSKEIKRLRNILLVQAAIIDVKTRHIRALSKLMDQFASKDDSDGHR